MSESLSRGLTARVIYRSKRQKSGSMEEEVDSPGEYYHSPSPASSSRNWTEDMEGGNRTWICPAFTTVLCRDPAFQKKKKTAVKGSEAGQEEQVLHNKTQLKTKNKMRNKKGCKANVFDVKHKNVFESKVIQI